MIDRKKIDGRRAGFKQMKDATPEDWEIIREYDKLLDDGLAERVLDHLRLLQSIPNGHPISQYEHSLQTATRAFRDGRDEDYVVCALLHDIGDILSPHDHARLASAMLKPFVSEALCWMVEKHPIFQSYHYYETLGLDPNGRDAFRGHPCFDLTAEFCELYDQCSFDPAYDNLPLEFFAPMVQRIMKKPV